MGHVRREGGIRTVGARRQITEMLSRYCATRS